MLKERECAMEWPELKYSSGVTWASTCQLDSNTGGKRGMCFLPAFCTRAEG
jgi:hypothetical protein